MCERFADMLQGGHPNSLGCAEKVVSIVLTDRARLASCSPAWPTRTTWCECGPLTRSRGLPRKARMVRAHVERLLGEVASIEQPSVQWHVAQMPQHVRSVLSDGQAHRATELLRHNLARSTDWIVLNVTMDVLAQWARCDPELSEWLAGLVAAVAVDEPRVRGRADGGEDDHDEEDTKAS